MPTKKNDTLLCGLLLVFIILNFLVKECSFKQPDGISITLNKKYLYTGCKDSYCFSSLFSLFNQNNSFSMKNRRKTLFVTSLLICGDIETQPGPESLIRDQFQFLSKKGIKIIHQNIRGLIHNFDMSFISDGINQIFT